MTSWTLSLRFSGFSFAFFFSFSLWAAPQPVTFLWNDSQGFVATSSCEIKNEIHIPFYISQVPNASFNSSTKFKSKGFFRRLVSASLLDRSVVAIQSPPSTVSTTSLVKVLSVPRNARREGLNRAEENDVGEVSTEALQEIGNFILEILELPKSVATSQLPFEVSKTFWQVAADDEYYVTLFCKESPLYQSYVVFDVYNRTDIQPVARVGLRVDQVSLLKKINVYTPEEANQLVSPEEPGEEIPSEESEKDAERASGVRPAPGSSPQNPSPAPSPATGNNKVLPKEENGAPVESQNPLEYILCTDDDIVEVRNRDLKKTLFEGDQFEAITPIQSWNEKRKSSYIEVQFPKRKGAQKSGWVPREVVQLKIQCKELKHNDPSDENNNEFNMTGIVLNTKDCCKFPTLRRSTQPYTQGILRFRARRNRGHRLHAGCDLYRRHGESTVAVASGIIIRGLYYFYQGVFALEIKHPRFIARYGEILGGRLPGIKKGTIVKAGQQIGRIGTVSSRCCAPMLHFELYSGTKTGPLTRYRLPPFDRRQDLINPTNYLRQWEKNQFGRSY